MTGQSNANLDLKFGLIQIRHSLTVNSRIPAVIRYFSKKLVKKCMEPFIGDKITIQM